MSTPSLVERLSAHRTLAPAPQHEITWVARHGVLRHLDSGDVLTPKQGPVEGLHIVLGGYLTTHVDHGAGRRKIMEWREDSKNKRPLLEGDLKLLILGDDPWQSRT